MQEDEALERDASIAFLRGWRWYVKPGKKVCSFELKDDNQYRGEPKYWPEVHNRDCNWWKNMPRPSINPADCFELQEWVESHPSITGSTIGKLLCDEGWYCSYDDNDYQAGYAKAKTRIEAITSACLDALYYLKTIDEGK